MNRVVLCAALIGGMCVSAAGQEILFADVFNPTFDDGFIRRGDVSVGAATIVHNPGGGLRGLAVDQASGKMYWCDVNNFAIRRANLDGTGQEDVINSGLQFPSVIKIDSAAGKFYWGDQTAETIERADLDGNNRELVIFTPFHRGLAIDSAGGKVYWSTSITMFRGDIRRSNFDGSNLEFVVTTTLPEFKPSAIALDLAGGKIYWTDYVVDVVQRSNLDGSNIQTLYSVGSNRNPGGLTLDLNAGKVYWGQDEDIFKHVASVRRMNLDGSGPQTVFSGNDLGSVNELVLLEDACYPDCNASGTLTIADFGCFQAAFAGGEPYADCNGSQTLTIADFGCFQASFAAGCP